MKYERDGKTYFSIYGHLKGMTESEVKAIKDLGVILEGMKIGEVGRTGNIEEESPTHLHFEISEGAPYKQKGSCQDPGPYFNTLDRLFNLERGTPIPETTPPPQSTPNLQSMKEYLNK